MMRSNNELRRKMEEEGVLQWQVAKMYGLSESNFSRLLREELPKEEKQKVDVAIENAKNRYFFKMAEKGE